MGRLTCTAAVFVESPQPGGHHRGPVCSSKRADSFYCSTKAARTGTNLWLGWTIDPLRTDSQASVLYAAKSYALHEAQGSSGNCFRIHIILYVRVKLKLRFYLRLIVPKSDKNIAICNNVSKKQCKFYRICLVYRYTKNERTYTPYRLPVGCIFSLQCRLKICRVAI